MTSVFWVVGQAKFNPFQKILYSKLKDYGFRVQVVDRLTDLLHMRQGDVVHLGWLKPIFGRVPSKRRIARTKALLEAVKCRGGAVVWTFHETEPLDATMRGRWRTALSELISVADRVHIFDQSHASIFKEAAGGLEKHLTIIPHPMFRRAETSRNLFEAGRKRKFRITCFGNIHPYKGFDKVIKALPEVRKLMTKSGPVELVIAGRPRRNFAGTYYALLIIILTIITPGIKLMFRHVNEDAVANLLSSSDLLVMPYKKGFSSGVIALAETYGVPVLCTQNLYQHRMAEVELISPIEEHRALGVQIAEQLAKKRNIPPRLPLEATPPPRSEADRFASMCLAASQEGQLEIKGGGMSANIGEPGPRSD